MRLTCPLRVALACVAWLAVDGAARGAPPADAGPVEDFSLVDVEGRTHTRAEWRDARAVVLVFIGPECPVSNGYSPDLRRMAAENRRRGVPFYGIHSDPSVTAEAAAAHAKEYGLDFPILLDPDQRLARATGARVTPEAFVVSPDGAVRYRGRIDDRYALDGKRRDEPTTRDLAAAVDAVLAGKAPPVSRTKAFGCPLPKLRDKTQ